MLGKGVFGMGGEGRRIFQSLLGGDGGGIFSCGVFGSRREFFVGCNGGGRSKSKVT